VVEVGETGATIRRMDEVGIRDATETDLRAVAEIYGHESLHGYSTFETEVRPVSSWRQRLASEHPFLVAEAEGAVVGFAYAGQFRDRPAYHRTVETSVYLHRDARGRRLGTALYATLLDRLAADFHTALALIALPNDISVRLHEQAGFALVGTMREVGDKQDRLIDVGVYQRML
jgi:phosphinothricin acetyltransferase